MLQNIRDNASGFFVMVVVGLVCLAMMSGAGIVASSFSFGEDPAIEVGDVEIYEEQIANRYRQTKAIYEQNNIEAPFETDRELLDVIVDSEVNNAVVTTHYSEKLSFPQSVLERRLMTLPEVRAAQTNDEKRKVIGPILRADNSSSTKQYYAKRRLEELRPQFQTAINSSAFVTETEIQLAAKLNEQQRDITTLRFAAADLVDSIVPSDEDLQNYYADNMSDYMLPARVKVKYIELDKAAVAQDVTLSEEQLTAWFAGQAKRYAEPEERQARDIVIAVSAERDDEAAEALANDIYQQLNAGADFAALVEQYSDDPVSKASGGEFDTWLIAGQADYGEDIQDAVFAAEIGKVIPPVEQDGAYHVLIVDDIRNTDVPSLADVREQAEADYRAELTNKLFKTRVDALTENIQNASPESLDDVKGDLTLEIQQSAWLEAGAAAQVGIAQYPEIVAAAFSDDIIGEEYFTEVVLTQDGEHAFVLQYDEYEAAAQQTLESVRADITTIVTQRLAEEAAIEQGEKAVVRIQAGESPTDVAADTKANLSTVEGKTRASSGLTPAVAKQAYQLPAPTTVEALSVDGVTDGRDYVVIAVSKVVVPANIGEAQRQLAQQNLQREVERADYLALQGSMVATSGVDIDVDYDYILNTDPAAAN